MRRPLALSLALSLLCAHATLARAEVGAETTLERAAEDYKRGVGHFKAGEYEQALLYFIRVYRVSPNPNLVYNIARAFEELQQVSEAADYYEEYLRLNPDAADRREVELSVKALRGVARAREESAREEQKRREQEEERAAVGARVTWGWVALGGAALSLSGGVLFGLEAASQDEATQSASSLTAARAARDARTSAAAWADGLYVGGAALVGVGLYLLLTAPDAPAPQPPSATPSVSVSPTGVSLAWSF